MNLDDTFLIRGAVPPSFADDVVQLGALQSRSVVAGPGERAVVWVAGCLRRCPGCMKPEWFSFNSGAPMPVATLARRILAIPDLDGVTFSGGEPFEQARALGRLSQELRRTGLNILVYTGYRLEVLRQNAVRFGSLLSEVDYLIDGEYRHELPGPFRWRGSQNQAIYDLRRNVRLDAADEGGSREIQLTLSAQGMRLTGFPNHTVVERLAKSLGNRGIRMELRDGNGIE